ncbi:MAG: polyprenyl synthetase family protein [Kiritimatiellaeota bacterium]|nr:polyprenyl synthetase family protein [Kiritimatiellota bacterium]
MDKNLSEQMTQRLTVPQDKARRAALESAVAQYIARERLVPPLTADELTAHARCAAVSAGMAADELPYVTLVLNNALWADVVSGVPCERRLLLLPQCLADTEVCRAERDSLGLICAQCGGCAIGALQAEADRLGYVTLVAEGTTVVSKLLTSGKVDAVIGVGCLDSLRRIFPLMNEHAIPGQGIPLLTDGCTRTTLDADAALATLRLKKQTPGGGGQADLERVSEHIRHWFTEPSLNALFGAPATEAQRIGLAWMMTGGKRWRPMLTATVFHVAGGDIANIRETAVGVECFHKASLIHDDIEDSDDERYGVPTVHKQYGVPAAINAGDYLLGEGYRLIASSAFSGDTRAAVILTAARGHRELSLGQGEELAFCRRPAPVTEAEVLRIYERKTAAAFEVAVLAGAHAAGVDEATCFQLSMFSKAAGVAYQLRDDIEDFRSMPGRAADLLAMRPTIFLAAACASDHPAVRDALGAVWDGDVPGRLRLISAISAAGLHARAELLYAHYRHETERVISAIQHTGLKRFLRRIMMKMLPPPSTGGSF